ncbi:MAG: restriction endonuclease [Salinibacter sp.]
MAEILTGNGKVYFDPFASDADSHFSNVVRIFFNRMWKSKHGINFEEYESIAKDSFDERVSLKKPKEIKKSFAEGVNKQFEERGLFTLINFAGEKNEMDFVIGWESAKESVKENFQVPDKPTHRIKEEPEEPSLDDDEFEPNLGFLGYIVTSRKEKKIKKVKEYFEKRHERWKQEISKIEKNNEKVIEKWKMRRDKMEYEKRNIFEKINKYEEEYVEGIKGTVEKVVYAKVSKTKYPKCLSFEHIEELLNGVLEAEYEYESRNVVLDYALPKIYEIPNRKRIEYVESEDEFKTVNIGEARVEKIYEKIPFNIALRVARQILEFDYSGGSVIENIVFNGYTSGMGKARCKVSVKCSRDDLREINLSEANPQDVFDSLGGISASSMVDTSSVMPIMQTGIQDSESVAPTPVGDDSEGTENLMKLDWGEFEQLIGGLLEREFANEGGEVEITQASQEDGIGAIAYDPDPLRGGKFVIQAERSAQPVGGSAVRDLHGTSMREGADKGVLITTSDFSRSAHDFAKDKLIQLLNGDDLLRLLDRHGYDAQIDLDEARGANEQSEL